jgi:predicted outer membrane repeat protein
MSCGLLQVSFLFLFLIVASASAGNIIYVDADVAGANSGSSWADAYNCLQDALAAAAEGDEIHVAQGIYKPDRGSGITLGDRTATFQLKDGVTVKGGYAGCGRPNPDTRNIKLYETILSGDLKGDDGFNFADTGENSYHVITGSGTDSSAALDGFTITAGSADGSLDWTTGCGGGIRCHQPAGSPTILNCAFTYNRARSGGAVYARDGSNPTIINCTFADNWADYGGAIYCDDQACPKIERCKFTHNIAIVYGGAMSNEFDCNPTITQCNFSENAVLDSYGFGGGGTLYNGYNSSPVLTGCLFDRNRATYGGAIRNHTNSNPRLTNCTFNGNEATSGGAIRNSESNSILTNCTFNANKAGENGGAIYGVWDSTVRINNCILWSDQAAKGDEVFIDSYEGTHPSTAIIAYSDVKGGSAAVHVGTNCTLNWGSGNISSDPLFMDADGADNIFGTQDDNLRLLHGSGCLDTGDNSAVPPTLLTDLDGNPRIVNSIVDIGAYEGPKQGFLLSADFVAVGEGQTATFTVALCAKPLGTVRAVVFAEPGDPDIIVTSGLVLTFNSSNYSIPQTVTVTALEDRDNFDGQAVIKVHSPGILTAGLTASEVENEPNPNILFVDVDVEDSILNNGANWARAFTDLQQALRIAAANPQIEEIRVAGGIYRPAGPFGERSATFQLINGLTIKGGYAGADAPDPDARDIIAYCTILSGDLNGDDVNNFQNNHDNSYHVVTSLLNDRTAAIDGFTITGGNASGSSDTSSRGGGMFCSYSSPTLTNCVFAANTAVNSGGGIYKDGGEPLISNCTFISNSSAASGGGMYNSGRATLNSCRFIANIAESGGGIDTHGDWQESLTLINCIITGNSARSGGGILCPCTSVTLTNCTVVANSATGGEYSHGGGLAGDDDTYLSLTNCIFWANSDTKGTSQKAQLYVYAPQVIVNYCCIQGWTGELGGQGNIGDDPLFIDPDNGSYLLSPGSPCIDAGTDAGVYTDIEGNIRPFDYPGVDNNGELSDFDMGAYEATSGIRADLWIFPQIINRRGKLSEILALVTLPKGIAKEQIDRNRPLLLYPGGIESSRQFVIGHFAGVTIFSSFDKSKLTRAVPENGRVLLTVQGQLRTGQHFCGSDMVTIIGWPWRIIGFDYLAEFSSQWLNTTPELESDLDGNGTVDFKDFSILAGDWSQ